MRIEIATLFPDMCETVLSESIIGPVSYTHLDVYKRQSRHCYGDRDFGTVV